VDGEDPVFSFGKALTTPDGGYGICKNTSGSWETW